MGNMNTVEKISVIVPTLNESGNIVALVKEIHSQLSDYPHEIIVVDDNSPDGTYKIVHNLDYAYVHAVMRTSNPGLAYSIRQGIEQATGDVIVVMDSDFNHQPMYLPMMIEKLTDEACVSASRYLPGGGMHPPIRHLLSLWFNIFIRVTTGIKNTDSLYGYFIVRKSVLYKCDSGSIFWGYGDYVMRLLYALQKEGIQAYEFPAINGERPQGADNRRFIKIFIQYVYAVFRLIYESNIQPRLSRN